MSKIIIGIAIVAVLGGGIWWFMSMQQAYAPQSMPQAAQNTALVQPTAGTQPGSNAVVDNSDAALGADLSSVDNQMNGLNTDSAAADQSLTDKPVAQDQL